MANTAWVRFNDEELACLQSLIAHKKNSGLEPLLSRVLSALDNKQKHQGVIQEAKSIYADNSDNDIEIDEDAAVSEGDGGVWVQAWVWVWDKEEGP